MRKNLSFKVLFVITTVVVLNSCGLHYTYTYQPDASKTGKILLKPTKSTNETTFRLNDSIIFSEKRVKSVTIENLPYREKREGGSRPRRDDSRQGGEKPWRNRSRK